MRAPATSDVSPLALVVALVVVNLAGKAGDALAAVLVESRPLTLLALNHVTRPFKFWGFSRAAAPFNGGDPKPPKPEPPTPFDEARTRRMKRMFQKYATRDDDGMIAASNLGELFADCGHAVPSAEELQGLLNRYPSHNDRDEAVGAVVKIGFEAFLKMAKFLEDEEQRKQGETTFFGQIYQQFVSSNNLAAMAGESS